MTISSSFRTQAPRIHAKNHLRTEDIQMGVCYHKTHPTTREGSRLRPAFVSNRKISQPAVEQCGCQRCLRSSRIHQGTCCPCRKWCHHRSHHTVRQVMSQDTRRPPIQVKGFGTRHRISGIVKGGKRTYPTIVRKANGGEAREAKR